MKRLMNVNVALTLVVMLATLVGCGKEQSSMKVGDMPNEAMIVGSYSYDEGQDFVNGDYIRVIKPAADIMVEVTLPADKYTNKSSAKGVISYYTYTDENGRFEISLPVPSDGVKAKVKPVDFVGTYTSVVDVEYGRPVYSYEDVVYTATAVEVELMPNAIKICDGLYTHNARNGDEGYPYTSSYKVIVGMATYETEVNEYSEEEIAMKYKLANNKDVIISVTYADNKTLKYAAATNNNGEAFFYIPTKEKEWSATISVDVKAFVVDSFVYYAEEYDPESGEYVINKYDIKGGYYEQANSVSSTITFKGIDGVCPYSRVKMDFVPFDDVDNYGYSKSDWSYVEF